MFTVIKLNNLNKETYTSCDNISIITVDGNWGSWAVWTDCMVSCGTGEINRTRECDSPAPQYGGDNCTTGTAVETDSCWNGTCYPSVIGNIDRVCLLLYITPFIGFSNVV